jgi:hypothetical protein
MTNPFPLCLAVLSLPLLAVTRVELRVADSLGVDRASEVVTSGVPFAAQTLPSGSLLHVETAAGRPVPTQIRVLGQWPDGSTKWLLVQFPATVAARATTKYFLVAGPPPPSRPIGIHESAGALLVDTGALRFSIPRTRFELLGAARGLSASSIVFELANGATHSSLRAAPPEVVVEERGPVRATVKVTGWLAGPNGEKYYRLESRLRFFAGSAVVQGDHTFTALAGAPAESIRRICYELATSGAGPGVAVRDFAHLGPNAIERAPGRLRIDLWSPRSGEILRFGRGRAKTHHILYDFANRPAVLRAFDQPLIADTTPEYFCSTNALGALSPFGAPETAEFDRKIDLTFASLLQARLHDPRESGLLHFGDYFHGGYGNPKTRGDLEYDTAHALFLEYARSADRRYFDLAVQSNQHFIDLDVNHLTGEQLFHGYGAKAETHQEILNRQEWGHIFTDGPADAWFLTGDERSLEILKGIADATATIADGGHEKIRRIMAGAERQVGWPLLALCRAYEATREPRYLAAARALADYLKLYAADPAAEYRHGLWWRSWMADGCKPFMVGALHEGLAAYYDLTADPALVPVIRKSLDWLIHHMWVPETNTLIYEHNAMNRGNRNLAPELNLVIVDAFRSGYEITGDERYLAVALHLFWSRVDAMQAPVDGKYFTVDLRTSPHTAAFLWRRHLTPGHALEAPRPLARAPLAPAPPAPPGVLMEEHFESFPGAVEGGHSGRGLALSRAFHPTLPVPADLLRAPGSIELWLRLNHPRTAASLPPEAILQIDGDRPLVNSLGLVAIYNELRVRLTDELGHLNGTAEGDVSAWKPGEWHHVAIRWDQRRVRLFFDGREQTRPDEGQRLWDCVQGLPAGPQRSLHLGWRLGNWYADATIDDLVIRRYGSAATTRPISSGER